MHYGTRRICYLLLSLAVLSLLGISPVAAEEPTLARLAFWVPPERMDEFGKIYNAKVFPLLLSHGLTESSEKGRATVDSVFSRMFAWESPAESRKKWQSVESDLAWGEVLQHLGTTFGTSPWNGQIRHEYRLYTAPANPGRSVPSGRGTSRWSTYDVTDGLGAASVNSLYRDRSGALWFGTGGLGAYGGGVSCYDGQGWTTFTTEDGLAHDQVWSILQDREGTFWFGTRDGVSRYDGQSWTTFATEDGLAHDQVWSIFQDRDGYLWFGTLDAGVSRYDSSVSSGEMAWTTFTTDDGLASNTASSIFQDRDGYLWFGTYPDWKSRGISRYNPSAGSGATAWTTFTPEDGLANSMVSSIFQDRDGVLWFGTWEGVSRYDGQTWTSFTAEDGLASNNVLAISEDRDGALWFGTYGDGVSCYDDRSLTTFTVQNGLVENFAMLVFEDRSGNLWIGTNGSGLSRYDGETWTTFTEDDGLVNNAVRSIFQDRDGILWFGTLYGVSRYDGETWTSFTPADGMSENGVNTILQDRSGALWFSTWGGVSRYDGETWTTLTTDDGLAHNLVRSIFQDRDGVFWFGTWYSGVSRYDGETWTTLTTDDGLAHNSVTRILQDRDGVLWFATHGGVSRYDGQNWTTFTTDDGLVHNLVWSVFQDRNGVLWFATDGGGVSRYDGQVFQSLIRQDGLGSNSVHSIVQDREGQLWFATTGGLTRYCYLAPVSPPVAVEAVITDRRHVGVSELAISSSIKLLAFEFSGSSFKTRPGGMVYRYRLKGHDEDWKTTRGHRVEYQNLPRGAFTFQVQAVDRDLNYSGEPAEVAITVHPPYAQWALMGGLGIALVGLIFASGYAVRKRRDQRMAEQALMQELEEELQTAHEMQMGLMPAVSPQRDGFDIAGRCLPANHVGGDFFQYFSQDGKLSICMADVTGHAMEAAVPVMMFSGVLKTEMGYGHSVEQLFTKLNGTMNSSLDNRTYVCFTMGELDVAGRTFRLANAACPYPFHFHAATGEVEEVQVDAYPLGVRDGTVYTSIETVLESGDQIVFCSDGIAEATNVQEEMFGFERTAETIHQACAEDLSAEALIDRLICAVQDFAGDTPQGDDMTVVVLKVEA